MRTLLHTSDRIPGLMVLLFAFRFIYRLFQ